MKGEKVGSKDLLRNTKTKRDLLFSICLFQIPLINCNKAFKAGPARAAVFQVTGALDSKAHRSGRGVGVGGGLGVPRTSSGPL